MAKELVVVLDFGGQYNQLIARRVRDEGVYAEVYASSIGLDKLRELNPKGIIFTGGPQSVYKEESQHIDPAVFEMGIPILGFCYGAQLIAYELGGEVKTAPVSEYGKTDVKVDTGAVLFKGVSETTTTWMSHTDYIAKAPEGFHVTGSTPNCPVAAMENPAKNIYATQFHPEVQHTAEGKQMLHNFLYDVCHCAGDWKMESFVEEQIRSIRETVGDGRVLLALSGGVDSSVAAALIYKAIGDRLTCVYVDHGFMRQGESEQVTEVFSKLFPVRFIPVDASKEFFADLEGVTDPEQKRKIIGRDFIRVFKREAEKLGKLDYFAQGTIYPDVIESGQATGAAVIKSHHNVGGLPKELGFTELIEPLRMLFKDEVRALGETLGLPHDLVWRQPFPGPGLAIRVMGAVDPEKVAIVRASDAILREEIKHAGLDGDIHQYFTVLTGVRSVGVMGDERTYDYTVALRAVTTDDFMTADWARIPYDVVRIISARIVNEVKHVNRVVLDVTTKPPASIEWE